MAEDDPDFRMPAGLKMLPLDKPKPRPAPAPSAPKLTPPERPKAKKPPPLPPKPVKKVAKKKLAPPKKDKKGKPSEKVTLVSAGWQGQKPDYEAPKPPVKVVATKEQAEQIVTEQEKLQETTAITVLQSMAEAITSQPKVVVAVDPGKGDDTTVVVAEEKAVEEIKKTDAGGKKKGRKLLIVDAKEKPEELVDVAVLGMKGGKRQIVRWTKLPKSQVAAFQARGSREEDPLLKSPTPTE